MPVAETIPPTMNNTGTATQSAASTRKTLSTISEPPVRRRRPASGDLMDGSFSACAFPADPRDQRRSGRMMRKRCQIRMATAVTARAAMTYVA